MRILVIDDNDEVASIFREVLVNAGFEVDRAASAYGAIIRAVHNHYDLVLMDLLLQETNGAVTALALRGLGMVDTPIVVITGGLLPIDEEVYAHARFASKLLKPVLPSEILAEIRRQLGITPDE